MVLFFCFFQLPFLFLKSHCKLAHLSGTFSSLRFLLALPVLSHVHVFERPRPRTWLCCLETRSGAGVTGFTDVGFGGSHREACGLGVLVNVRGRPALPVCCVWYRECLTSVPRVHYTTLHVTDTSSSAGTPESLHVHLRSTSDPQPLPPPWGPMGFLWFHCPRPGGGGPSPSMSLGPSARTVVELGAFVAKRLMSGGHSGIRPHLT